MIIEVKNQNQLKKKRLRQTKPDQIQKPLWIKLPRKYFESLIKDVADNLNNNKFKTSVDRKAYDLRNAKKLLVKITTQKISEKEAFELYSNLIAPDITSFEESKGKSKDKRENILNVQKI